MSRVPRTVVITGASSGIGRCTAALFGRNGWRVGLIARGEAGLEAVRRELATLGAQAATAVADVADAPALERAAASLERQLGSIDVWINCAGNGVLGRFLDVPEAEFRRVTDVTYMGTVNGTRVALRRMRAREAGTIVNVCSAVAFHGMPLLSSYSGAKCAVRGFTDAVRSELIQEDSRVHLTSVFPPAVNTPFFRHSVSHMPRPMGPMRPVYQPEIVADGILLAATTRRREVHVGSVTVLFALANKVAPGLMDRAIRRLGFEGQMTDDPEAVRLQEPTLFAPSARPSPARGAFDAIARRFSVQGWVDRHRAALAAVALVALAAAVLRPRR